MWGNGSFLKPTPYVLFENSDVGGRQAPRGPKRPQERQVIMGWSCLFTNVFFLIGKMGGDSDS